MEEEIPEEYLILLKRFIKECKARPSCLHNPSLKFFKDYLMSLGANIPEKEPKAGESQSEQTFSEDEKMSETEESENGGESSEESEESVIDLDKSGVVEPDNEEPLPYGDEAVEVTEDMLEESSSKRMEAMQALSEGDKEKAITLLTASIVNNPQSAIGYSKRAGILLSMNKPNAAIQDCNKALSLNPDQALAYKYRGRAHRLLGNWEEAAKDLALACKLDYSDEANEWLKEVSPNVKKLQEHRRKYERKRIEKELRARNQRAKAAHGKAKETEIPDLSGFPGFGGAVPPDMQEFLKDPEVAELLTDPEVSSLFGEMNSPECLEKLCANPKVMKIMTKIKEKMAEKGSSA